MSEVLPLSVALEHPASAPGQAEKASTPPFGKLPHGIASDPRITNATDLRLLMALLYFAYDSGRCTMADWRLADYANVSDQTVTKSLGRLRRLGLIGIRRFKPHPGNMTGREIILLWHEDPAILAMPPDRKAARGNTRGSLSADGPSTERDGVPTGVGTGSLSGEGEGPYAERDKEDALEELSQEILNTSSASSARGRDDDGQGRGKSSRRKTDPQPYRGPEAPPESYVNYWRSMTQGWSPAPSEAEILGHAWRHHLQDCIRAIAGPATTTGNVNYVAELFLRVLDDKPRSREAYQTICGKVRDGSLSPHVVVECVRKIEDKIRAGAIKSPAKYFASMVEGEQAAWEKTPGCRAEQAERAARRETAANGEEGRAAEQKPSRAAPTEADADRAEAELMAILAEVTRQRETIDRAGVERAAERICQVFDPAGEAKGSGYWHLLEALVNGYALANVSRHIAKVREGRRTDRYYRDRPVFGSWWLQCLRPDPRCWKSTAKRRGHYRAIFDWKGMRAAEAEARRAAREARRQAKAIGA